jgi:hypothetical protein
MKIILSIFILITGVCNGQLSIVNIATSNYSTSGYGVISLPVTQDNLYIIFVGTSNAGGTPATVSITGAGTWTEIGTSGGQLNNSGNRRMQAFRQVATSTTTIFPTVSYSGSQDGGVLYIFRIDGVVITGTNGSDAIVQTVGNSGNSANPSVTMSALSNRAGVIMTFISETNPPAGSAESGWTEEHDGGYTVPDTGGYLMHRVNTTDNTPTVTASSSNWGALAIEFKASGRRIFNTN